MTRSLTHLDPTLEASSRERVDALLDEAPPESSPASDSSAIGTRIAAIKKEHREHRIPERSTQ